MRPRVNGRRVTHQATSCCPCCRLTYCNEAVVGRDCFARAHGTEQTLEELMAIVASNRRNSKVRAEKYTHYGEPSVTLQGRSQTPKKGGRNTRRVSL